MDNIDKIELCLHEILMIKEILATQKADDLCSRILAIYAVMRVDDIVKYYADLPENIKDLSEKFSEKYHKQFNQLRDKFGAHFQHVEEGADMLNRIKVFHNYNCNDIYSLIDDAIALYQLGVEEEQGDKGIEGFENSADKEKVENILKTLYSDDKGMLTIGSLDIFAPNKGCIITMSKPQQKVQHLRSFEVIEDIEYQLASSEYEDASVKMMFKRMYISTVVNFYDNLVSRKDVSNKTNRGELGFDALYKFLYCKRDDKTKTEKVFDDFENKYKVDSFSSSIRKIRNQACAHLTDDKPIKEIEALLNTVNLRELKEKYNSCLDILNYVVCNVFLLRFLNLPSRIHIPSAAFVTMDGQVDFYGRPVISECTSNEEMTPEKAWRIVRKGIKGHEEANKYIKDCLFSVKDDVFAGMISLIFQRLSVPNLDNKEISMVCKFLIDAKRGDPERLQDALLANFKATSKENRILLIFIISNIAVKDKDGKIYGFIKWLNSKGCYILSTFSALTAMRISVSHSTAKENLTISQDFKDAIDSITHPTEHLAIVVALCNHWFEDCDVALYRKSSPCYETYLLEEVHKAIDDYCSYIKADEEFSERIRNLAQIHRFNQLQFECGEKEKTRDQITNAFWTLTEFNCMHINMADKHEAMFAAMLSERIGNIQHARTMLERIKKDWPLNNDVQNTYEEFCKCHPIDNND